MKDLDFSFSDDLTSGDSMEFAHASGGLSASRDRVSTWQVVRTCKNDLTGVAGSSPMGRHGTAGSPGQYTSSGHKKKWYRLAEIRSTARRVE